MSAVASPNAVTSDRTVVLCDGALRRDADAIAGFWRQRGWIVVTVRLGSYCSYCGGSARKHGRRRYYQVIGYKREAQQRIDNLRRARISERCATGSLR